MSIDLEKIQSSLCAHMCSDVRLLKRNGHTIVNTPFSFPDGDPFVLYLEERPGGLLRLTDAGHTMMHLSYESDVDKFRQGTRGKLFEQVLANGGAEEDDGQIFLDTAPDQLGTAVFRLSQTLASLNDLTFLNRARAESTFYEDLAEMLGQVVDPEKIQKDYVYPNMQNAEDYPIDFRIEGKFDPLFVFGIPNRDKARLATIVLERLLRAEAEFDSVLIFADQGSMPRSDLARLSNAGGEMIASLDAQDDLRRKVAKRAA